MERRAIPPKRVLMSGTIEFADSKINCIVGNMSIAGAALDVINPNDVHSVSRWSSRWTKYEFPATQSGGKKTGLVLRSTRPRDVSAHLREIVKTTLISLTLDPPDAPPSVRHRLLAPFGYAWLG